MFHTLTKKMLSSAEVVAQVELKFIIIKTCGIICAVDQHAADERVALEKLVSALSNPDMHDDTVICMTKRSITKRDLLKTLDCHYQLRHARALNIIYYKSYFS